MRGKGDISEVVVKLKQQLKTKRLNPGITAIPETLDIPGTSIGTQIGFGISSVNEHSDSFATTD